MHENQYLMNIDESTVCVTVSINVRGWGIWAELAHFFFHWMFYSVLTIKVVSAQISTEIGASSIAE